MSRHVLTDLYFQELRSDWNRNFKFDPNFNQIKMAESGSYRAVNKKLKICVELIF